MIDIEELANIAWFVISPEGFEQFCSCAASPEQSIQEFFFAEEEPCENEYWDNAWWLEKQSEGFKCEPRLLTPRRDYPQFPKDMENRYRMLVKQTRELLKSYDEWREPDEDNVYLCDFWLQLDKLAELVK